MAKKEKVKKPFYKKVWVWVLAVIIIGAAASGGGESEEATGADNNEETNSQETTAAETENKETTDKAAEKKEEKKEEKEEKVNKIGDLVEVGNVAFKVNGTSTADNVGGEYGETANGTYILVDVEVKNIGKEAITTDSNFFKLVTEDGTEFEADSMATTYANDAGDGFFLEKVNPTLTKNGTIAFDVSPEIASAIDTLTLHVQEGMFGTKSDKIALSK